MTQSSKFTFLNLDTLHGGVSDAALSKPRKRVYTDEQIREIQDAAFAEGIVAGEQSALTRIEKRAEESLDVLSQQYSTIIAEIDDRLAMLHADSAELALLIAKKLAAALIESQPLAEIERLFSSCIPHLNSEPRVVVRVHESQIDILKDKIDTLSRKAGYPGRIVILGEPDAQTAQCQIEWADGGVVYRSPEQIDLIDKLILDYATASAAIVNAGGGRANSAHSSAKDVNPLVMDSIQ